MASTCPPFSKCNSKMDLPPRKSEVFSPSLWGDYFLTCSPLPSSCKESETWMKQRSQELIANVKEMLIKGDIDNSLELDVMHLIDALQRLGVDYHFEKEIDEALRLIHDAPTKIDPTDLHRAALRFRLLRQHRYHVSSDVFNVFKDAQGSFSSAFCSDIKGLLNLYEAAYLGMQGEDVLVEAISFTRSHLKSMASHLEPPLRRQVLHALESPLRRRLQRLEARRYISIYEQDLNVRNEVVLELAKLDFHMLQQLHRQEIQTICTWWTKWDFRNKFPFARDRIVECYFWSLGVQFEPHYSKSRIMLTKVTALCSTMDDLYDNYGKLPELQQYTDVINRWNAEEAEQLEECCKLNFHFFTSIVKEFEDELAKEGLSYRVNYVKEMISELNRAYLVEAKWREEGYVPSLSEHLNISSVTSCYDAMVCTTFAGMGSIATKEALDWVINFPKIIMRSKIICRLMDDISDYEIRNKWDHVASTIHCYIKEYGGSNNEACEKFLIMIEDAWKDINKEFLNLAELPTALLMPILNLTRLMEAMYKNIDGFSNPEVIKEDIELLLVQPIDF